MKELPVAKGQKVEVEITDFTHSGEGVGRVYGMALFVPGALPGDRVEAVVTQVKKNFAKGELVEVLRPSPGRVESDCLVSGECGGCQLRSFNYQFQLEWKQKQVREALRRIGGFEEVEVLPTLGMAEPNNYRNKTQFRVGRSEGRVVFGFYQQKTNRLVPVSDQGCLLQQEPLNNVVNGVAKLVQELDVPLYDPKSRRGVLKGILVKSSRLNQEAMVVIVTKTKNLPKGDQLARLINERYPEVVSIYQNTNPREHGPFLGKDSQLLWGKETIIDAIGDLKFQISPHSFFQVNSEQTEVLYRKAREYAGLTGTERVFDLYCGIGTISLFLAPDCREVIGIEEVEQAVADAEANAGLNQVKNVSFRAGRVEEVLPELLQSGIKPDVVVLDPPRAGAAPEVLEAIVQTGVERVVYVSCNPATLARDLRLLAEHGYEPGEVQPVDMFPHTSHVECVVSLQKKLYTT
ncbi:MAG: 23S rRNA (uracil(1939)-C(5))-methyltransferase RlmD [Firmicutes bacterium]|nr:23S rRNA (uracil(1939)-C(5))-methyltransferase RlmD [Bacillota bacterium]